MRHTPELQKISLLRFLSHNLTLSQCRSGRIDMEVTVYFGEGECLLSAYSMLRIDALLY